MVIVVVILTVIVTAALHAPFTTVQSISISRESDIDQVLRAEMVAYAENAMRDRVYGIPGKARYFFKKSNFEDMLRTIFLQADSITVGSSFLNKWHITARKRISFGTYCVGMRCLMIDTKGIAFMETDIAVGNTLLISDTLHLGDQVFGGDVSAILDFQKIPEVVLYLENSGFLIKAVSLRQDTRVVHIELENSIGIWLDTSETLYDTTRALHIVFEEVFTDPEKQAEIISVDVRNPLSILYEKK